VCWPCSFASVRHFMTFKKCTGSNPVRRHALTAKPITNLSNVSIHLLNFNQPPLSFATCVADPDPGSRIWCFLTPGYGIQKSGSGMNIQPFRELNNNFLSKKFLDSSMRIRTGSGIISTLHPGSRIRAGEKFRSGINIPNLQHCFASQLSA
jgi:hypothetical protein